ncbi:hypothetical protein [Rhodoferax sp.]|jgi:uncharacterized protein (DUF697 family)|uniref:hypothetical protein n=1 Tax=Rhodoferax sp. TaxID=50421 RepID=UPI0037841E64
MSNELTALPPAAHGALSAAILDVVLQIPRSREQVADEPARRARAIAQQTARRASVVAGSLALPPGPLGWLTVLPEMLAVWRLQAQMVSDIAAVYGKTCSLGREQLLYCLFKQVSAQLLRDIAVRVGERVVFQAASSKAVSALAQALGVHFTTRLLKQGGARLVPLIGAIGVGAYAYADTMQVAKNALILFESEAQQQSNAAP